MVNVLFSNKSAKIFGLSTIIFAIFILIIAGSFAVRAAPGNPPPTVSTVWPTITTQNVQTLFKVNASDNKQVNSCEFFWQGANQGAMTRISGTAKSGTWARNYTSANAGTFTARADCTDNQGAKTTGPNTSIQVNQQQQNDTQAPTVSSVTPTSANEDTPTNYQVTASDNVGVTSCNFYWNSANLGSMTLVSGNSSSGTWQRTYTETTPGTYNARGNCTDAAGNIGLGTLTTVTINDATPPGPITNLGETATGTAWIYWQWTNPTDSDLNQIEVWLNGTFKTNTSGTSYNATGLNSNTGYQIQVRPVDNSGNIGQWTNDNAFTQQPPDTQAPTVSSIWPTTATQNQQQTYKTNASDNVGVTSCNFYWNNILQGSMSLISGTSNNGVWARNHTESNSGIFVARSECQDAANNNGIGPNTTITVNDVTPPGPVTNLQEAATGINWIHWTWSNPSDPDLNHIEVWLNSTFKANTTGASYNATGLQANTGYQIQVRPVDNSGNIGQWTNDSAFTQQEQDTQPPTVSSIAPTATTVNISTNFSVTATDNVAISSCTFYWDNTSQGNMSNSGNTYNKIYTPTAVGTHVASVTCIDTSSNEGSNSTNIQVNQPQESFIFTAAGDHGAYWDSTNASLQTLSSLNPKFDLALGDLSYGDNNITPESKWCDYVKSYVGATFPFQLISGNHEDDGPDGYITNFAQCLPDRLNSTGTYGIEYYFDYPANSPLARVIMIPPNLTINNTTYNYLKGNSYYNWLSNTIDSARAANIPWVVVGMHKVCLSTGGKPCEIGKDLNDLLIDKKVDLVLQGHEHNYQRSKQLKCADVGSYNSSCVTNNGSTGKYWKDNGTVFAIVGTFGVGLNPINTNDPEYGYFAKAQDSSWGILKVNISRNTVALNFVKTYGADYFDNFEINVLSDFYVSVEPSSKTMGLNQATNATVSVTGSSNEPINLSISGCPSSTTCTLSSTSGYPMFASTLTITTTNSSPQGTFPLTITASNSTTSKNTIFTLAISSITTKTYTKGDGGAYSETDDSYIYSGAPNNNYGSDTFLYVDASGCIDTGTICKTLVKYPDFIGSNSEQVPPNSTILNATLEITVSDIGGIQSVYQLLENWNETGVAWNSFAVPGAPQIKLPPITFTPSTNGRRSINITSIVQRWVNGEANFGILINSTSQDGVDYHSSEAGDPEKLTVAYT